MKLKKTRFAFSSVNRNSIAKHSLFYNVKLIKIVQFRCLFPSEITCSWVINPTKLITLQKYFLSRKCVSSSKTKSQKMYAASCNSLQKNVREIQREGEKVSKDNTQMNCTHVHGSKERTTFNRKFTPPKKTIGKNLNKICQTFFLPCHSRLFVELFTAVDDPKHIHVERSHNIACICTAPQWDNH